MDIGQLTNSAVADNATSLKRFGKSLLKHLSESNPRFHPDAFVSTFDCRLWQRFTYILEGVLDLATGSPSYLFKIHKWLLIGFKYLCSDMKIWAPVKYAVRTCAYDLSSVSTARRIRHLLLVSWVGHLNTLKQYQTMDSTGKQLTYVFFAAVKEYDLDQG